MEGALSCHQTRCEACQGNYSSHNGDWLKYQAFCADIFVIFFVPLLYEFVIFNESFRWIPSKIYWSSLTLEVPSYQKSFFCLPKLAWTFSHSNQSERNEWSRAIQSIWEKLWKKWKIILTDADIWFLMSSIDRPSKALSFWTWMVEAFIVMNLGWVELFCSP